MKKLNVRGFIARFNQHTQNWNHTIFTKQLISGRALLYQSKWVSSLFMSSTIHQNTQPPASEHDDTKKTSQSKQRGIKLKGIFSSDDSTSVKRRRVSEWREELKKDGRRLDLTAYTNLIIGFFKMKDLAEVENILEEMTKEKVKPDSVFYAVLVDNFMKIAEYRKVHRILNQLHIEKDLDNDALAQIYSVIITGYFRHDRIEEADEVIAEFERKNLRFTRLLYNAIISGYVKQRRFKSATDMLRRMRQEDINPDIITYSALINGYTRKGKMDRVAAYLQQMKDEGIKPDAVLLTIIINGHVASGDMESAKNVLTTLRNQNIKDDYPYNAIITGYIKRDDFAGAHETLNMMKKDKVKLKAVPFNQIIKGWAREAQMDKAKEVYALMREQGIHPDPTTLQALQKEAAQ